MCDVPEPKIPEPQKIFQNSPQSHAPVEVEIDPEKQALRNKRRRRGISQLTITLTIQAGGGKPAGASVGSARS